MDEKNEIGSKNYEKIIHNEINSEEDFKVMYNRVIKSKFMTKISDRKKIYEELKESEEKYRAVFDNASDMISLNLINENGLFGKFIDVNKVGIKRLGYSRDEFLNMTPFNIITPNKQCEMSKYALKLFENGHVKFEIIHQTKDGRKIPVEINSHIFELKDKKIVLAISRNIIERKKAESTLKYSEKKYRTIFENIQNVYYQIDNNGIITEISPYIKRNSGYEPEELIGKPVESLYLNPEDRKHLLEAIKENGEVHDFEILLKTKTNNILNILLTLILS